MSLSQLEQSLRAERIRPRCVRVNLRLWYALKSANLIASREMPLTDPGLSGLRLPHLGDVLVVLDPDLEQAAFDIERGTTRAVTKPPKPQPAPHPPDTGQGHRVTPGPPLAWALLTRRAQTGVAIPFT